MKEIDRFAHKGLTLSTFGFGMGNYNDVLLEQLAKKGNGSYAYIDNDEQGQKLFADNLVSTVQLLARDVKIQVEFNPSTVSSYRLIGYENRAVPDQKFRDNKQDGGEIKAGHEVTALYELNVSRRGTDSRLATINVRWSNLAQEEVTEVSQDVTMPRHITSFANARPQFRLAVAVARFAELLKGTEFTDGCFAGVLQIARRISNEKPSEQTREFCGLIQRAQSMTNSFGRDYEED
jgi:Ca-activated chloride channel family protein